MIYTNLYNSPLGPITMAGDEEALTGLWFHGQKYFGSTLPERHEVKSMPVFEQARKWLDVYFSGREPDFMPPLSMETTPFRKAVWEILLGIPYGKTITYGEIAAEIARQKGLESMSAQAVGSGP